ncbi:hypothetical protein BaRGS_00026963 [Batillaria attramentaria]|uniref:Uncharacterized protein n=1 Tax=Batillaria attramentaria TaxID=370345 RepID=A0ABD0K4R3_9CAEN
MESFCEKDECICSQLNLRPQLPFSDKYMYLVPVQTLSVYSAVTVHRECSLSGRRSMKHCPKWPVTFLLLNHVEASEQFFCKHNASTLGNRVDPKATEGFGLSQTRVKPL